MRFVRTMVLQISSLKNESADELGTLDVHDVAEMGSVISDVTEAVFTSGDQEDAQGHPED